MTPGGQRMVAADDPGIPPPFPAEESPPLKNPPAPRESERKVVHRTNRPCPGFETTLLVGYLIGGVVLSGLYFAGSAELSAQVARFAKGLHSHWILAVGLALPLFYRPVRGLLDDMISIALGKLEVRLREQDRSRPESQDRHEGRE